MGVGPRRTREEVASRWGRMVAGEGGGGWLPFCARRVTHDQDVIMREIAGQRAGPTLL